MGMGGFRPAAIAFLLAMKLDLSCALKSVKVYTCAKRVSETVL